MLTSRSELRESLPDLLPDQGEWSEDDYLWLTDRARRLIEYTDGWIEVLPMPTDEHQGTAFSMAAALRDFLHPDGVVRFAPLRLRLGERRFREPDILALLNRIDPRRQNRYWRGADIVIEIVSPDKPERDLVEKREEYGAAGIPEYWIINPLNRSIVVLSLRGDRYVEHGVFGLGDVATSALLAGFSVAVSAVFEAGRI